MSLDGGDIDHSCMEQTSFSEMDSSSEAEPHLEIIWMW